MATQTKDATAPSEVTALDTSCYDTEEIDIEATMANATFYGTPTIYGFEIWMWESDVGIPNDVTVYISKDGGSGYCSGHVIEIDPDASCDATNPSYTDTCSHSNAPLTESEARDNSIKIKILNTEGGIAFVNFIQHTWTYTPATVPGTPADPTLSNPTTSSLDVSSISPTTGGSALDNVQQQLDDNTNFLSAESDWTKGSAPSDPEDHTHNTGLSAGTHYYARARYSNGVGWGSYNPSAYNSLYTLCATVATPSVALNGYGSIRVSWGNVTGGILYRIRRAEDTNFTIGVVTLTSIDTGTPYDDDTPVDGVEYFYRVQAKNPDDAWNTESVSSVGIIALFKTDDPRLSDTRIKREAFDDESRLSDTRIKKSPQDDEFRLSNSRLLKSPQDEEFRESDSRIKKSPQGDASRSSDSTIHLRKDEPRLSDTRIKRIDYDDEFRLSDTRIKTLSKEISRLSRSKIMYRLAIELFSNSKIAVRKEIPLTSDSRILNTRTDSKSSDSRIIRVAYDDEFRFSDTRIKQTAYDDEFRLSNSRILRVYEDVRLSDSRILVQGYGDASRSSDSRIKNIAAIIRLSVSRIKQFDIAIVRLSDSRIGKTTRIERSSDSRINLRKTLQRLSNSRIIQIDNEIVRTSDSRIIKAFTINRLSDSRVKKLDTGIVRLSDSRITQLDNEINRLSDTRLSKISEQNRTSDTRLKNTMEISRTSYSDIAVLDNEFTRSSDSRLLKTFSVARSSDSRIRAIRGNLQVEFTKIRVA